MATQAYLERYRQLSALDQQKNDFIEVRTQFLPWSVIHSNKTHYRNFFNV
mgnify:CR=1 FL=1|jgi:hypothetical protein